MDKHLMQPADSRKEDQESKETKDEMEYGEIVIQTTKTPECRKSMEKLSKKRKTSTWCVTERKYPVIAPEHTEIPMEKLSKRKTSACVTERKYPVVTQKTQNRNRLLKWL